MPTFTGASTPLFSNRFDPKPQQKETTMKSWKTTVAGILTALIPALTAASAFLDNDPLTIPDWGLAIAGITAGLGLLFARDNNVTSEGAGAK